MARRPTALLTQTMIAAWTLCLVADEDVLPIERAEASVMLDMRDLTLSMSEFSNRWLAPIVHELGYGRNLDWRGRRMETETVEVTHLGQRLRVSFAPDGPSDMHEMIFRMSAA